MSAKTAAIGPEVSNGAARVVESGRPYRALIQVRGDADLLFHRWNCEEVEAKSKASKGSKAKKTDNIESYVYRNDTGEICVPGEMLRQSIIHAAKYKQDPRSPRKSAMDLMKAGIVSLTPLAGLGITEWHYEHRCRVTVQRNSVTRVRPAVKAGWEAEFVMLVALPEYIDRELLHSLAVDAGRLCGLGDFRPTYGRFQVTRFEILE